MRAKCLVACGLVALPIFGACSPNGHQLDMASAHDRDNCAVQRHDELPHPRNDNEAVTSEEYAVLRALFDQYVFDLSAAQRLRRREKDPDLLTIVPYTLPDTDEPPDELFTHFRQWQPTLRRTTYEAYRKNNARAHRLRGQHLQLACGRGLPDEDAMVRMLGGLPQEDRESTVRTNLPWEMLTALRNEFPNAKSVFLVSRPGIDETGTQALLYVQHIDARGAGESWSDMLLMVKENGQWAVKGTVSGGMVE